MKNDCHALQKLLTKFRVDKVTEADMENIRQAKQQLESSSAGIRARYQEEEG